MPTYEYRCPQKHDFERFFRKISDAPSEVACPTCGEIAARRMSAGAGLLFKGSGFYLTDYGKNAHRGTAPEKGGDGKTALSSGEGSGGGGGGSTKSAEGGGSSSSGGGGDGGSGGSGGGGGGGGDSSGGASSKPESKPAAESKSPPPKAKDS